ncbi:hypothetical protein FRB93_013744 [Tulasnella sp. JGI-2019a]|nr:hypothetical protein FRB93_013744 [Tulasnella sp. JGI-2019a]
MVATHMPDITCLVVVASHHHDMPLLSRQFPAFRQLHTLRITIWDDADGIDRNHPQCIDLIACVRSKCPRLEHLTIERVRTTGSCSRLAIMEHSYADRCPITREVLAAD